MTYGVTTDDTVHLNLVKWQSKSNVGRAEHLMVIGGDSFTELFKFRLCFHRFLFTKLPF